MHSFPPQKTSISASTPLSPLHTHLPLYLFCSPLKGTSDCPPPQLGRAASGSSKEELDPGTGPWEHINMWSVCLLPWLMTTHNEQLETNITTRQAAC